jgi:protein-serine/threonine kinase
LSSLTASLELGKLTKGAAATSRIKSTPPQTPRALSRSNGADASAAATAASQRSPVILPSNSNAAHAQSPAASANSNGDSATSPELGPPKGKLFVKIIEARGLRASYDPYVVCVFEWNEYISRGPKTEQAQAPEDKGLKATREEAFGGLPIKRSVSDIGRSITIPMKSRQSSTTSLSDQKNFKAGQQVTNPKWDHEAIL